MRPTQTLACLLLAATATAQWAQQATQTSPTSRTEAAMAFDLARGQTVLFGGGGVGSLALRNDTWLYDGSNWSLAAPATSPTGRFGMSMVYDQARSVSVFYGGLASMISIALPNNQTWEWDGTDWTQAAPAASPPGLTNYGLAYDSTRQRVVLYGGSSNPGLVQYSNQTWEYDGTTWTQIATANNPLARQFPGMCYHAAIARTVLFGGTNPQTGADSNTWSYDGANWTLVAVPVASPSPRSASRMVYDNNRAVCVMHGGVVPTTGVAITETWEFNGVLWQQVQTPMPSPRTRFAMAYDMLHQKVVLHGGIVGNTTAMLDTHEYGANVRDLGPGCPGSNGVPVLGGFNDPRLGTTFTTTLGNLANTATLAALVAGFLAPNPPLPLDGYGMPGCLAHVSADAIVFLPVLGGVMTAQLAVPSDPSLFGVTLHEQGLSLDPGVNAAGLVVSNAITATIGW